MGALQERAGSGAREAADDSVAAGGGGGRGGAGGAEGRLVGTGGGVGGPAGAEGVRVAPAPEASCVGRGGKPGRAAAPGRCGSAPGRPEAGRASGTGGMTVPPEGPRVAEGVEAEPVRPSPAAG